MTLPRLPASTRPILIGIMALSVIVRVAVALVLGDEVVDLPAINDQLSYDALAQRVLAGHGFTFAENWWPMTRAGEPTAHWSYLYTLYLAAVYALFGAHPLVARLLQAVITGVLYPFLAWRVGRRIFGDTVGLVAAALVAGYGYFIYYAGALMTETFYILVILWSLDLAVGLVQANHAAPSDSRSDQRVRIGSRGQWLLLGLALGTAVLLRQLFMLLIPLLFLWLIWAIRHRGFRLTASQAVRWRSVIGGLAISTLIIVMLILPWTLRNYQAFGRFVLLNTNAGFAFFWGNHPIHGTDFVSILPMAVYPAIIPAELRKLDEAALDQALLREGLGFVVEDPWRYAQLSLSRIPDYFQFWPSEESNAISNVVRLLSFGAAFPLMIYGLCLGVARWRSGASREQQSAMVLLFGFVVVYTGIHLLSWALIRYRLPVDAVLLLFAALGLVDLARRAAYLLRRDRAMAERAPDPLRAGGRQPLVLKSDHVGSAGLGRVGAKEG